jgi:translation initiation factor 2D
LEIEMGRKKSMREEGLTIYCRKGTLQPITLSVKTRQGRKTITLITGLETFSIAPEEFAEDLKKLCAGSTTVSPLAGASPKLGLSEVMVQGSWVKVITDALVMRGVPKKWIKEGDKK